MAHTSESESGGYSALSYVLVVLFLIFAIATVVLGLGAVLQYFNIVDVAPARSLGLWMLIAVVMTVIAAIVAGASANRDGAVD